MDFNKMYINVVGNEINDFAQAQGKLLSLKNANTVLNPNNRYRVETKPGPDEKPVYFLYNVDLDKLVDQQKFHDLQQLYNYAHNNKIPLEPYAPSQNTLGTQQVITFEPEE